MRSKLSSDFRAEKLHVIVATVAFGMGVDKSDVRLVAHYDVPGSVEQYWQEAGRAGRDGQEAFGLLLHSPGDLPLRRRILPYLLRIRRELHVPLVYVTHDAGELSAIADRVLMLEAGRVARAGPPAALWPAAAR